MTACSQIVDCLIENVLNLEECSSGGSSQRLVACLTSLYLFAKIRPQLLVKHAITLQPYLSLKCQVSIIEIEVRKHISYEKNNTLIGFPVLKPGETFSILEETNHYKKKLFASDFLGSSEHNECKKSTFFS